MELAILTRWYYNQIGIGVIPPVTENSIYRSATIQGRGMTKLEGFKSILRNFAFVDEKVVGIHLMESGLFLLHDAFF